MTDTRAHKAQQIIRKHTAIATATGAIPVPGASVAIVAENTAMVAELASLYGVELTVSAVVALASEVGGVNLIGRTLFVEAARAMGWFAGPLGALGISALGATTAGLQAYTLGQLARALARSEGRSMSRDEVLGIVASAKQAYRDQDWN